MVAELDRSTVATKLNEVTLALDDILLEEGAVAPHGERPVEHRQQSGEVKGEPHVVGAKQPEEEQDLRVELRYALRALGLPAAPFVTLVLPTHDYEYLGHSAIGRHTRV